jgi:hypothetical protein
MHCPGFGGAVRGLWTDKVGVALVRGAVWGGVFPVQELPMEAE